MTGALAKNWDNKFLTDGNEYKSVDGAKDWNRTGRDFEVGSEAVAHDVGLAYKEG